MIEKADAGVKQELEALIAGGYIEKPVHEDITYEETVSYTHLDRHAAKEMCIMIQRITDKLRVRRKKLLHDYIAIFIIMGTILFLSFLIIGYIADSSAMEQSRNSSRVIYKQAREQLEQFEEDLQNMYMLSLIHI